MNAVRGRSRCAIPNALALENVTVRFGGLVALDGVTLQTRAGEIVGIIGPNGAGKTTLLNVITGIIKPNRGSVSISGTICTQWAVHRRARLGLARTFQRVTLYSELSVGDHFRLAAEGRAPFWHGAGSRADGVVAQSIDLLARLGWRASGEERAAGLPLGRSRLIELVMAMATAPSVLLLDEPLSGLAGEERQAIVRALRSLQATSTVTVVLVDHDLASVRQVADRLVVLDFGKVICEGAVETVLADESVRRAYFGGARS